MKKIIILITLFGSSFLFCDMAMPLPGEVEVTKRLEKILRQTNINKRDVEFVRTNIYFNSLAYTVRNNVMKVIVSYDLKELLDDIKKVKWIDNFPVEYFKAKDRIKFIYKILSKNLPHDDSMKGKGPIFYYQYFRHSIHDIIFSKQIRYNKINKKYSDHIVKEILSKIKEYQYGTDSGYELWIKHKLEMQIVYNEKYKKYSEHIIKDILPEAEFRKRVGTYYYKTYKDFLAHKKKAKSEKWPIADENGK